MDVCVVDFKDMMNTSEEMCLSMMFNSKKDMRNDCFTVISLMSLCVCVYVCISLNSIAKDMGKEEHSVSPEWMIRYHGTRMKRGEAVG